MVLIMVLEEGGNVGVCKFGSPIDQTTPDVGWVTLVYLLALCMLWLTVGFLSELSAPKHYMCWRYCSRDASISWDGSTPFWWTLKPCSHTLWIGIGSM